MLVIVLLPEQFIVISLITNTQSRFSLHFTPPTIFSECRGLPKTSYSDDSQKYSVMCHQRFSNELTEYQKKFPDVLQNN